MSIEELVSEDDRRAAEIRAPFNPITGEGSVGNRKKVHIEDMYPYDILLPVPILQNKLVKLILKVGSIRQFCLDRYGECSRETREKVVRKFIQVRCKHDFPFYAYAYNFIKNKEGGRYGDKVSYP